MGGRYLISGTQIGMLISLVRSRNLKRAVAELRRIEDKQFVGSTDGKPSIEESVQLVLGEKIFLADKSLDKEPEEKQRKYDR